MKLVKTEEAVGHVLCHDMTQIIPGVSKDARFRKGHIVTQEDIPVLLSMGKKNLYVWEKRPGILHEDEAAEILFEICHGANTCKKAPPKEGKIELLAACDGLLKINREKLLAVNSLTEMMIATRAGDFAVKKGDLLAATRIIPLVIEEEKMAAARAAAGPEPIVSVIPFGRKKVGIVTTGSEVFSGRIQDAFGPAIRKKLARYDVEVLGQSILDDQADAIAAEINAYLEKSADMILCTGGMSVDPDDTTPPAIQKSGAEIISYGAPVLPGAMFLLAYQGDIPIMGLPGCVMYAKQTVFDLVLPRVMAGEKLTRADLAQYGEGGLCLNCPECTFPNCGFGK